MSPNLFSSAPSYSDFSCGGHFAAIDRELSLVGRSPVSVSADGNTGWASHYGGLDQLARYCGMLPRVAISFDATWNHGVFAPWDYSDKPYILTCGVKHDPARLVLVANDDERRFLCSLGYNNVYSIGCPFVYACPPQLPARVEGSVLLMPAHTIDGAPFERLDELFNYAAWANSKYHQSSGLLYASVHMSCIRNRLWWPQFFAFGIPVIAGADPFDSNSYARMWQLFSRFEVVSTNVVGSHVFYALALGCKVVIEGPSVSYSDAQLLRDSTHSNLRELGCSAIRSQYVTLSEREFVEAFAAPCSNMALGAQFIGLSHKRDPADLRRILGWKRRGQVSKYLSSNLGRSLKLVARLFS